MRTARAAAVLPVAVFLAADPAGWYPFGPAKWFAASVVAMAAIVLLTLEPVLTVPKRVGALWLALLALIGLSMVTALDPRLAWLGTAERNLGLVAWMLFGAMTIVGANIGRSGDGAIVVVVRGVVVATLGVAVYVVIELIHGAPIELATTTDRLGGPFGSAAYLGAAMTMAVPACAGMACDRTSTTTPWRVAAGIAAFGATIALLGSGSRAAIVAAAVAATIVVASRWRPRRQRERPRLDRQHVTTCLTPRDMSDRRWLVLGLGVLAALAVVAPRIGEVTDRSAPASSRIDEWANAVRVVGEHPLVGGGPESYRITAAHTTDAEYERTYGRAVMPDRAHNGPLDVAAIAGIPAMLVYVALLIAVGAAGLRVIRRARPLIAGLGAAVVAYAIQQLALFPVAEVDLVFWLLAGVVVVSAGAEVVEWRSRTKLVATAVTAVACLAVFMLGVAAVSSDRLARDAAEAMGSPARSGAALADARRAIELRPDSLRVRVLAADLAAADGTLHGLDEALSELDAAREWSPHDPFLAAHEARLLLRRAEVTGRDADVGRALAAWQAVVGDAPNCYECQLGLGAAAALAGDEAAARQAWTAAAALSDDDVATRLLTRLDVLTNTGGS